MGLLDDAIKDHLELKRRHGADPTEVARIEHEALGPARREPEAAAAPAEAPVAEPAVTFYDDDDPGYDDEVPAEERLEAPRHREEPEAEADQPTAAFSLEELEAKAAQEEAAAQREAAERAEAAEREAAARAEAAEREAAPPAELEPHPDVVPADDEPGSDDVLEETPDFLQETPEHDRLWFEQKPPRDFDF